jgi:hypothetical protein
MESSLTASQHTGLRKDGHNIYHSKRLFPITIGVHIATVLGAIANSLVLHRINVR